MVGRHFAAVSVQRHTDAYVVPSRAESASARLVSHGDPSNLLLVLSAEERRALLKLLWGGLVATSSWLLPAALRAAQSDGRLFKLLRERF